MGDSIKRICNAILGAADDDSILKQANFSGYLKDYIAEKYEKIINSFEVEKSMSEMNEILQMYIEDETLFFQSLSNDEIKTALVPDEALKQIEEKSFLAFEIAKDCKKKAYRLDNSREYENWLSSLSAMLDGVKEHNASYARELLSEALLDIEYAYGKTDHMSLRLTRA